MTAGTPLHSSTTDALRDAPESAPAGPRATHPAPGGHRASADPSVEPRVGNVEGDRPCTGCGFNLYGQPIVRERHYQMLMVRCPECGAAASLQEYPLLGRWASRWGALLAAMWALVVLGGMFATAGIILGVSQEIRRSAAEPLGVIIAQQHREYQATPEAVAAGSKTRFNYQTNQPVTSWENIDITWWETVDQKAIVAQAGAAGKLSNPNAYWDLRILAILMLPAGIVFAVAMPGLRRSRFLVPVLMIAALALLFVTLATDSPSPRWAGWFTAQAAAETLTPSATYICIATATAVLIFAMLIGRPVVRWLVVVLLPPRLRVGLSVLWTCDGLPPPSPRASPWTGRG